MMPDVYIHTKFDWARELYYCVMGDVRHSMIVRLLAALCLASLM